MRNLRARLWLALLLITVSSVIGCASSFEPRSLEAINFQERSQTQVDGNYRVTASVLSAEETEAVFGFAIRKSDHDELDKFFFQRGMGNHIGPGKTIDGFVYTNLDEGTKAFNVDIIGEDQVLRNFTFLKTIRSFGC